MTKQERINRYREDIDKNWDAYKYNLNAYPEITLKGEFKCKGCRYEVYPYYDDITDFTDEEIFANFYIGDIIEIEEENN